MEVVQTSHLLCNKLGLNPAQLDKTFPTAALPASGSLRV